MLTRPVVDSIGFDLDASMRESLSAAESFGFSAPARLEGSEGSKAAGRPGVEGGLEICLPPYWLPELCNCWTVFGCQHQ